MNGWPSGVVERRRWRGRRFAEHLRGQHNQQLHAPKAARARLGEVFPNLQRVDLEGVLPQYQDEIVDSLVDLGTRFPQSARGLSSVDADLIGQDILAQVDMATGAMTFNSAIWGDAGEATSQLHRMGLPGFSQATNPATVNYIVAHEYGHIVQRVAAPRGGSFLATMAPPFPVSGYGSVNQAENWAEAFAGWVAGKPPAGNLITQVRGKVADTMALIEGKVYESDHASTPHLRGVRAPRPRLAEGVSRPDLSSLPRGHTVRRRQAPHGPSRAAAGGRGSGLRAGQGREPLGGHLPLAEHLRGKHDQRKHGWRTTNAAGAIDALQRGEAPNIDASEVGALMELGADRTDNLDLTEVHVNGTPKFGLDGLGYARTEMPVLGSAVLPGYLASLQARGIKVTMERVNPQSLKPMQREVSLNSSGKLYRAMKSGSLPDKPLVVSRDSFTADGHHRWAAATARSFETKVTVSVIRVDLPGRDLHADAMGYNAAQGITPKALGEALAEHQPGKHDQKKHGLRGARTAAGHNEDGSGIPFARRLGRCYELSGRYAMAHEDGVLVHGSIQGFDNPRIGHGWVERKGQVYEPISNQLWHPIVFDALFNPKVDQRYTADEWKKQVVETRHWGPWGPTSGRYRDMTGKDREADT